MILPSKLCLCLVWPFWSSITFYVSCAKIYSSHARPLFTWRNLWHVPTISHISPVRTAGGADGEDLAGPWGDVISGGQEAATQSSFHQLGRHGNNFEMMMVMIRVLKPGLLVDKEYISFIYWSWLPKVKGIIWTILLFATSSSASMNQTHEGESSSRSACAITQSGSFC